MSAQVAQLVEQGTENPRVGGSIPPLGTKYFKGLRDDKSASLFSCKHSVSTLKKCGGFLA